MPALKGRQMGGNHRVTGAQCPGCGHTAGHRRDCTLHPGPLRCCRDGCPVTRLPGVKLPLWGYNPTLGYLCPEHK